MTLQQVKYAVSALAFVQVVIMVTAIVLIIKHVVVGIRKRDKSKYRKALRLFGIALGLVMAIGVVELFILLE
jgi:uncharacterized membrane protein